MSQALQKSVKPAANSAANKKKALALLALVAVGLLLWGRLLIQQVPRTVVADPAQTQAAAPLNLAAPDAPPGEEAAATPRPQVRPQVTVDMPSRLARDLFALDAAGYTRTNKDEIDIRPAGKSEPKPADDNQQARDASRAANGLVLQTTILGDPPRAMINGQLLRLGQKIRGFELRKVLPRQVILEMNGVEVRLQM